MILDSSDFHHVWINHSGRFTEERNHINGIRELLKRGKTASTTLQ